MHRTILELLDLQLDARRHIKMFAQPTRSAIRMRIYGRPGHGVLAVVLRHALRALCDVGTSPLGERDSIGAEGV